VQNQGVAFLLYFTFCNGDMVFLLPNTATCPKHHWT